MSRMHVRYKKCQPPLILNCTVGCKKFETIHLLPDLTAFLILLFYTAETSQKPYLGLNT